MKLRAVVIAVGLAAGAVGLGAGGAVAGNTTTVCPTSVVFLVTIPDVGLGLPSGSGLITTHESPTGNPGQCEGTFTVTVTVGGVAVASGELVANHNGASVSATFEGSLANDAGDLTGSLSFDGTIGSVTVNLATETGCASVTSTFAVTATGFITTGLSVTACSEEGDD